MLRIALFPFRHGVRGNWITEIYYFSSFRWKKTFRDAHLVLQTIEQTGLFYTGYGIPGPDFPMEKRSRLARYLGSSTALYVLKKTKY